MTLVDPPSFVCADVTKLIAADSFIQDKVWKDPEAEVAFEDLSTILVNSVPRYFHQRRDLKVDELGPVAAKWIAKPDKLEIQPLGAQSASIQRNPIVMNYLIAEAFARTFVGIEQDAAVRWARFQFCDAALMRVFWGSNTEREVAEPYDFLRTHHFALQRIRQVVRRYLREEGKTPFAPVTASNEALSVVGKEESKLTRAWEDEDLIVAFLAWNYLKGYRYIASLQRGYSYAVHFLREPVINSKSAARSRLVDRQYVHCFPWGRFLRSLMRITNIHVSSQDYAEIIDELRRFHNSEFAVHGGLHEKLCKLRLHVPKEGLYGSRLHKARRLGADFARRGLASVHGLLPQGNRLREVISALRLGAAFSYELLNAFLEPETRFKLPKGTIGLEVALISWVLESGGLDPIANLVAACNTNRMVSRTVRREEAGLDPFIARYIVAMP